MDNIHNSSNADDFVDKVHTEEVCRWQFLQCELCSYRVEISGKAIPEHSHMPHCHISLSCQRVNDIEQNLFEF
jgi:hypothetical protein